jgi:hypothetical protein
MISPCLQSFCEFVCLFSVSRDLLNRSIPAKQSLTGLALSTSSAQLNLNDFAMLEE